MGSYLCLVICLLFNPLYRGGVRLRAQNYPPAIFGLAYTST